MFHIIMMWATVLTLAVSIIVVWADNDGGKGVWAFQNIVECANPAQYPIKYELSRRKLSRTLDGFSFSTNIPQEITETNIGLYVEMCTKVDGGCRLQFVFDEESLCNFCRKMLKDNFYSILALAGLENADCPIPKGDFIIEDYEIDYNSLPEDGMYGEYTITAFLVEVVDNVKNRIACVSVDAEFKKREGAPDDQ